MKFVFTNFGSTTLAAAVGDTSAIFTVPLGQGNLFPEPDHAAGERFSLVLRQADGTPEIVHCWKREDDNLHVIRAQENTTAQAWAQGSAISLRTTAEALNDWASVQANAFVVDENHHFEVESVTVVETHVFADDAARDAYFADPATSDELVDGVTVQSGTVFQTYDATETTWSTVLPRDNYFELNAEELVNGVAVWLDGALQVYDSANDVWRDITAYIEGPPGPTGTVTQEVVNAKDAAIVEVNEAGDLVVAQAEAARDQAEVYATTVLETNALAYDPDTYFYDFPMVAVGSDGLTYRAMGDDVTALDIGDSWTVSASGTNEYYYTGTAPATKPDRLGIDGSLATEGTVGTLAAGTWGWGDNDTLGANTFYVRLSDGTDPDTKTDGYIKYRNDIDPVTG